MGYNPGGGVLTIQDKSRVVKGWMAKFCWEFVGKISLGNGWQNFCYNSDLTISVSAYIV